MANATLPSGLMTADGTDNISKMKEAIFGTSPQTTKTLNQRLGALTNVQRSLFQTYAKFALMMMKMQHRQYGYSKQSYDTLISSVNKGMQPELKSTLVELLETIAPIDVREEPKAKLNGISFYSNPKFFPQDLQQKANDRIKEFQAAAKPDADAPVPFVRRPTPEPEQLSFIDQLGQSESSGRTDAEITLDDGRRHVGRLQFGEARLKDYQNATGTSFTQDDFKENIDLQERVEEWHVKDLAKAVDDLGEAAKDYSMEGLLAVGHLGGKSSIKKYVESKGKYDPEDQLGTSLSDYYNKFSGAV